MYLLIDKTGTYTSFTTYLARIVKQETPVEAIATLIEQNLIQNHIAQTNNNM